MRQLSPEIAAMPLIMDIGMNNGRDSLFYLRKGFRVVAVEASPPAVENARINLASFIESGQLVIEPVGLAAQEGEFIFYANLDNDHWSSFNKSWGTRNGTRYLEIPVKCIRPQSLFETYGIPYYLKIDIEGNDIDVICGLSDFPQRPKYLSIEESETSYFAELWSVGCRQFKLVDQSSLSQVKCPNPSLEGKYVDIEFDNSTSGPFGEEAPGEWLDFSHALETYLTKVRSPTRGWLAAETSWFDIHGRTD